jgi:hypothetical protein
VCQECVRRGGPRARLIDAYVREFPEADFGGGHIVFADYNVRDEDVNYCLNQTQVLLSERDAAFLRFLLTVRQ